MKTLEFKQQFAQLKTDVIEAIKLIINSQDIEIYSSEDLEEGDYDVDEITFINDLCEKYEAIFIGCKGGKLLFYDIDIYNYEGEVKGISEVYDLESLLKILELLERNS